MAEVSRLETEALRQEAMDGVRNDGNASIAKERIKQRSQQKGISDEERKELLNLLSEVEHHEHEMSVAGVIERITQVVSGAISTVVQAVTGNDLDQKIDAVISAQKEAKDAIAEELKNGGKTFDADGNAVAPGQGMPSILQVQQNRLAAFQQKVAHLHNALAAIGLNVGAKLRRENDKDVAQAFAVVLPEGYQGTRDILAMSPDDLRKAHELMVAEQKREQERLQKEFEERARQQKVLQEIEDRIRAAEAAKAEELARAQAEAAAHRAKQEEFEAILRQALEERKRQIEARTLVNVIGSIDPRLMAQLLQETKHGIADFVALNEPSKHVRIIPLDDYHPKKSFTPGMAIPMVPPAARSLE